MLGLASALAPEDDALARGVALRVKALDTGDPAAARSFMRFEYRYLQHLVHEGRAHAALKMLRELAQAQGQGQGQAAPAAAATAPADPSAVAAAAAAAGAPLAM